MSDKPQFEGLKAATEKTKQIITLATGVITITVTFLDKFGAKAAGGVTVIPWPLFVAWGLLVIAIVAAVLTLGAITGTLDCLDKKANGQTLSANEEMVIESLCKSPNIRVPAIVMDVSFMVAMIFTVVSGLRF
jgi:hypothetical protein